jgi:hypothetical protein
VAEEGLGGRGGDVDAEVAQAALELALWPGQKPPFSAVKHLAHPYKSAIENRFTVEDAKAT